MNILADSPVPGLVPNISVQPITDIAASAVPKVRESTFARIKETLTVIYAFGLLGFGVFFPFVLAAWSMLSRPAGQ